MSEKARTLRSKAHAERKHGAVQIAKRKPGTFAMAFPRGVRGEVAKLAVQGVLARAARVDISAAARILAELKDSSAPEAEAIELLSRAERAPASIDTPLEEAFRRGDERRAAILRDPSMLTGEAAAERLGVSRETINKRAQQGKLLALEFGKRGKRYPDWQFEDGVAGAPLERVLVVLRSLDPWQRFRFFKQVHPGLGGRTPVAVLRQGESESVEREAAAWAGGEQGGG